MHLILIYLSVIMLLGYVIGSEVQYLVDECTKGRVRNSLLTYGLENKDSLVIMIKTQKRINCILDFSATTENYIMLVLEFPDLEPEKKVCVSQEVSSNLVMVSDYKGNKDCQSNGSKPGYRSLSFEKASAHFTNEQNIGIIKVTATSMRDSTDFECVDTNETVCLFDKRVYCMTLKVGCDGHNNCGFPGFYDEDVALCKGQSLTFLMILSSSLMGVLTIFLFGSICLTILPKRKETFVYKTDDTLSIFDIESEIYKAEINIQIIFSENVV